ncbi:MAG: sulfite exporter TauE/SafE family protein [Anaerolineales bacterium]|nr:sulfite exporter TauE/SafE family protein [Anaerolineales bacterium]MCB0034695.1 sulfite exporter TauE/SafE family protein [Anaerolineales bacterium]
MEYLIICTVAVAVSALTFFSGFGLGTMLMPAFALFFPVPVAVAATAVVHLANNIFKVALIGRQAKWPVVWRFAAPATVTAMIGTASLTFFDRFLPLETYHLGGRTHEITVLKLVIGTIIIIFALFDLLPKLSKLSFDRKYLPLGGALSGFFGGLSGNQGALRSAFLIKLGLDKEAFVGTGVVAAIIVDIARLLVYGAAFYAARFEMLNSNITGMVVAAMLAAFVGAFIGRRLLKNVTLRSVQPSWARCSFW